MGIWDKIKKVGKGILSGVIGGIPGALLGAASSAFSASQQAKANLGGIREGWDRSEAEAQRVRDFQLMMSNTAYQRSMADMKAAGLNPILAYSQGGASSGFGAQANISGGSPGVNFRDVALTANELASAKAVRANLRQQNFNIKEQNKVLQSDAALKDASTAKTLQEARRVEAAADRAEVVTTPFRALLDLPPPPKGASAADIAKGMAESAKQWLVHKREAPKQRSKEWKDNPRNKGLRKWLRDKSPFNKY